MATSSDLHLIEENERLRTRIDSNRSDRPDPPCIGPRIRSHALAAHPSTQSRRQHLLRRHCVASSSSLVQSLVV